MTQDIARLRELSERLRIRHGDPKPTVSTLYDAADAIDALLAQLEAATARIGRLEEALEQIIKAPLIDHSDNRRSKDGIAKAALSRGVETGE